MNFEFSSKAKKLTYILMGVGIVALLIGLFTDQSHATGQRFWSNLLVNGFFFFGISLAALFFLALQYATETGWSVLLKRIFEGVIGWLPYGAAALVLVFAAATFHLNHIYHWMDPATYNEYKIEEASSHAKVISTETAMYAERHEGGHSEEAGHDDHAADQGHAEGHDAAQESGHGHATYTNDATAPGAVRNDHYDSIIANKRAYLNEVFFWIRSLIYLGIFIYFARKFRARSILEDTEGGTEIHFTNFKKSATFLVLFAVFSSTMSWDWIMSIDTHWFSTLFGWYTFSGMFCSAMITFILLTLYVKSKGYLTEVNDSHLHDLGKWMFATSFLWSYMWFSQFMLIWYSNIPEEVPYFITRIQEYKFLFFFTFVVNFAFPMLMLMSRDAKRTYPMLVVIGLLIFVGHWLDVFMMVMPGTMHEEGTIGIMEIGMFIAFLGGFIHVLLKTLTKAPIRVQNHPYLDECLHHHT